MAAEAPRQLIYFVSGMWCSTCAKNIRNSVLQINGVDSADLNYASKLLIIHPKQMASENLIDTAVQTKVHNIGFGIKRQPSNWLLHFNEKLQMESNNRIPWAQVCLVWFLAMWSSMLAFIGYTGQELSPSVLFNISLASSALGLPAILIGILPYAESGIRALLFSRLLTLDLFICTGGCAAVGITVAELWAGKPISYADSGSMIIAILLLAKKIEITLLTTVTSRILYHLQSAEKSLSVFRKNVWISADISQIRKDDRVRIQRDETVSLDGRVESETAEINNHLINGEARLVLLKKGDHVFAGAIARQTFEMSVLAPQGERRIDSWAEAALLAESRQSSFDHLFAKIENALVIIAFCGALGIATIRALNGYSLTAVIESFFVGILIFCPCLFASIIPLTKQITHLALLKHGILLQKGDALLRLSQVRNFYFDKTGTLEAVESAFIPFTEEGRQARPYLKSICQSSKHTILRSLDIPGEASELSELNEIPGVGLRAKAADGTEIIIGRPNFLRKEGLDTSGYASSFSLISVNQKIVGQIIIQNIYNSKSRFFLRKLLKLVPRAKIDILSGDPRETNGEDFTRIDSRITYKGNLLPEEKAALIRSPSAFVGDGLNDTLALAKSDVSFRIGYRTQGFAPVDFQLQIPNLDLVLTSIRYAKKYRTVLLQTAIAALIYNTLALTLAAEGKFSPLGAVISMFSSFSLMFLSILRLNNVQEVTK